MLRIQQGNYTRLFTEVSSVTVSSRGTEGGLFRVTMGTHRACPVLCTDWVGGVLHQEVQLQSPGHML